MSKKPQVGLGVIIENNNGQILIAKRKGSHAPYYSIPGGRLELGEAFEAGAIREVNEEHGIRIHNPKVIAITNNIKTFKEEGVHFISVILKAQSFEGTPTIMEPDKCTELLWADPHDLPVPHFDASKQAVDCWLHDARYLAS